MTRIPALITLLMLSLPASASSIVSWYPQVIEHIYINDTVSETIEYSVTTSEHVTEDRWTVDGKPFEGIVNGNTYYFERTWENQDRGFHIVNFNGNYSGTWIEFRWYVNVYEIGGHVEGSIFDVIEDSLDAHAIEIKKQMFRYAISGEDNYSEFTALKARQMQDYIKALQMRRESLTEKFKAGNITFEEYVAAIKHAQREARFYMKLSIELAKITRSQINNEDLGREFENFSLTEEDWLWHEGQLGDKQKRTKRT